MAQTRNDEIKSLYFDNIVRLVVEALNDSCINIALCEVPENPWYNESEVTLDSSGVTRTMISPALNLRKIKVRDLLRSSDKIDSLINVDLPLSTSTGPMENQFPMVNLHPGSKWIIFIDSPYLMSRDYHDYAMEKLNEYEEKLRGQVNLNANNYFTVYEDACAFCTYFPEDAKYPPMFIYSEGLVDDFRTIIEVQENPSLLSKSEESYEDYYNSMKEELGRRVFSKLFENTNQE